MARASSAARTREQDFDDQVKSAEEPAEDRIKRVIQEFVGELSRQAEDMVGKKAMIEDRWFDDLRRYNGRLDSQTEQNLRRNNRNRVYVNWTRNKTHAWESRLCDLLFPTDDRNWGIMPTPVPTLVEAQQNAAFEAQRLTKRANLYKNSNPTRAKQYADAANDNAQVEAELKAQMDEAKKRAEAMQAEIEDQLVESNYAIKARECIHDSCKLGTGIMKGPMFSSKTRRRWQMASGQGQGQGQGQGSNVTSLWKFDEVNDDTIDWQRVDPWNFFPDMNARTITEAEFTYERHLMNQKDLRKLASRTGFDNRALNQLCAESPREALPNYVSTVRDITSNSTQGLEPLYQVWEWHGRVTSTKLKELAECYGDEQILQYVAANDNLADFPMVVWFCQGHLLYYGPYPMESCDTLYSVFNFHKDDSSIFGFGIPFLMQNSQAALNGAWRFVLDAGVFASGPQIIIDREQLQPANNDWNVKGPKVWYRKAQLESIRGKALEIVEIVNQQERLQAIINLAIRFADEEASMPVIAQGEQAGHVTQTAGGMAILMNSANVVFRRVVRNFDDCITIPNIQRAYDWNMENSTKQHIKGDYRIQARGSSVLLVRELQAQNLMAMLDRYSAHPILGRLTKIAALYRKTVAAHMISADDVVKSDNEIKEMEALEASQPPPKDPALQIAEIKRETELMIAEASRETALITLAEKRNMNVEQLRTKLGIKSMEIRSNERKMAAELGFTERRDARAAQSNVVSMRAQGSKPSGAMVKQNQRGLPKTAGGFV